MLRFVRGCQLLRVLGLILYAEPARPTSYNAKNIESLSHILSRGTKPVWRLVTGHARRRARLRPHAVYAHTRTSAPKENRKCTDEALRPIRIFLTVLRGPRTLHGACALPHAAPPLPASTGAHL